VAANTPVPQRAAVLREVVLAVDELWPAADEFRLATTLRARPAVMKSFAGRTEGRPTFTSRIAGWRFITA
jgi:hypothetical protein